MVVEVIDQSSANAPVVDVYCKEDVDKRHPVVAGDQPRSPHEEQEREEAEKSCGEKPTEKRSLPYVRRPEQEKLVLEAYQGVIRDRSKAFLLISGEPGIGKSVFAERSLKSCLPEGGYLMKGTFDAFHEEADPFRSLMESTLKSLCPQVQDEAMTRALEDVVELERQSISSVMQRIKPIAPYDDGFQGEEEEVTTAGSSTSEPEDSARSNRFNQPPDISSLTMKRFASLMPLVLGAITTVKHQPALVLIDNLCKADPDYSLELLEYIMSETSEPLIFVGTCRVVTEPIQQWLEKLESNHQIDSLVLKLDAIDEGELGRLQEAHFSVKEDGWLAKVSGGNPAVVSEILDLYQEKSDSVPQTTITLHECIDAKVRRMPKEVVEVMKVASCFGHEVDGTLLQGALSTQLTSQDEELLAANGLPMSFDDDQERFTIVGSALQDGLYGLVKEQGAAKIHLRIGRRLLRALVHETLETRYPAFIVFQLRRGLEAMTNQEERIDIAIVCLEQGGISAKNSRFGEASSWLDLGITLLGDRSWRDEYHLTLSMYNLATEVAFAGGQHEDVRASAKCVKRFARCYSDTLLARCMETYSIGAQGLTYQALSGGLEMLKQLNEPIPEKVSSRFVHKMLRKTNKMLGRRDPMSLLRLPTMKDPLALAKMQALAATGSNTFILRPELTAVVAMRMMQLSLEHGLCSISALGFVKHGMFLTQLLKVDEGYKYGRLAIGVLARFQCRQWLPRVYLINYTGLHGWKHPFTDCVDPLKLGYRVGLRTGDIEGAMLLGNGFTKIMLVTGQPLTLLKREVKGLMDEMKVYCQEKALFFHRPCLEFIQVLTEGSIGLRYQQFMDDEPYANSMAAVWMSFLRLSAALLLHDPMKAYTIAMDCINKSMIGGIQAARLRYFASMAIVSACHDKSLNRKQKRRAVRVARKNLKKLKQCVPLARQFALCKAYLLEAEIESIRQHDDEAAIMYDSAIAVASKCKNIVDEALAAEKAGRHHLRMGNVEEAREYFCSTIKLYEQWGATTKLALLAEEIRSLPNP